MNTMVTAQDSDIAGEARAGDAGNTLTDSSSPEAGTQTDKEQVSRFQIGGEVLWPKDSPDSQLEFVEKIRLTVFEDIRIRVGTLLKTESVSILLGAGASKVCGGPLLGSVPLGVERRMLDKAQGEPHPPWLDVFYRAVEVVAGHERPLDVKQRIKQMHGKRPIPLGANLEVVLATLHRWRSALPAAGGRLTVTGAASVDVASEDLDRCLVEATHALAGLCVLPTRRRQSGLQVCENFVRKILTRPLNLRRTNLFTLNYDTLMEQAADALGVVLLDGFVGTQRRVFRPESYEQDLYFPAETTEGRVHRLDRVLHLYKLHGSITWEASEPTMANPYGVESTACQIDEKSTVLIYPTPAKYGETLGMPYTELFRRFAVAIVRPQSVLVVIGYGFGDEHVNAIIRQALAVPSFTLVIVDPSPERNDFITKLREQEDRRIWIVTGTFASFVNEILPDLRDEEIRKRVLATHRAVDRFRTDSGGATDGD